MLQRKRLLGTTVIAGLTVMAMAAPALAQTTTTPPKPAEKTKPAADEAEVEAVVVTGSRIKRTEYNSASAISVITSEQASLQGLTDTAEIIQQSAVTGGAFQVGNELTGYVTTGGPGVNTVSLRGLGANRTLVLFNGHRLPPSGVRGSVGPVDLTTIPNAVIERVEILKDGASSIYGSDAVAGVVNYISKKNLDGGVFNINANVPFSSGGGGQTYSADGAWGKTFDRGFISASANYYKSIALRRGDRDGSSCAEDYLFNPKTGQRVDWLGLDGNYKCYNMGNNYVAAINSAGSSLGSYVYRQPGISYPTSAQGNNSIWTDLARMARNGYPATFPYANYDTGYYNRRTLISPQERYGIFLEGQYNLGGSHEVYGEFLYNKRKSEQDSARQLFPTVAVGNPGNRFTANGYSAQPVIAIPYDSIQDIDYTRVLGGIRGDFSSVGGWFSTWNYDVYGQYGKSSGDYSISSVYADRIAATTGASGGCVQSLITISGGQCSSLSAGYIPWTSERVLAGNFTAEESAFLFGVDKGHTDYEQYLFEGSLAGDLFNLPAGPVGAAIGATYRHDKLDDMPGRESVRSNNWGLTAAGHTFGSDATKEIFGELAIPVFKGLPFIEHLDLSVSGRYTDVDSYGSDSTYKVGADWQIASWVKLRGSYGTSFRAPALYELYLANQTSYQAQTAIDPCVNWGQDSNVRIQANCAAAGIPSDYAGAGSSALIYAGGGAGVLEAETSKASTIGIVLSPSFVDLRISVDYFDIKVENEVERFGAANILEQCYNTATYNTSGFCSLFSRDAVTHQVTEVYDSYVNVAEQRNRGIDLTFDYGHEFSYGRFNLRGQFTWQLQDTTRLLGAQEDDYNGTTFNYRGPDFMGNLTATFTHDDWTGFWTVSMLGKGSDTEVFGGDVFAAARYANLPAGVSSTDCTAANSYCVYYKQYNEFHSTHSVSLRRKFDTYTVTAGIQNVFNDEPPASSTGQFRAGTWSLNGYDYRGRRGFVTLQKRF
jgi:iron complex outermembrane receptor protein